MNILNTHTHTHTYAYVRSHSNIAVSRTHSLTHVQTNTFRALSPTSISSRNAVSQATWFTDEVTTSKRKNIKHWCVVRVCVHERDRYWFEKWACVCALAKKNEYISTLLVFGVQREPRVHSSLYLFGAVESVCMGWKQHTKAEAWYVWTKSEHLLVQSNLCIVCRARVYMNMSLYVFCSLKRLKYAVYILWKPKTRLLLTPSASSILFVAAGCCCISDYHQRMDSVHLMYMHRQTQPPLLWLSARFSNISQNASANEAIYREEKTTGAFCFVSFFLYYYHSFHVRACKSLSHCACIVYSMLVLLFLLLLNVVHKTCLPSLAFHYLQQ